MTDLKQSCCVTCGLPELSHSGIQKLCPIYATFRAVPHPPMWTQYEPIPLVILNRLKP
jgi:hypothetical protein